MPTIELTNREVTIFMKMGRVDNHPEGGQVLLGKNGEPTRRIIIKA